MEIQALQFSHFMHKKSKKSVESSREHNKSVHCQQTDEKNNQPMQLRNKQKNYSESIRQRNKRILTDKSSKSLQVDKASEDPDDKINSALSISKKKIVKENKDYFSSNNIKNGQTQMLTENYLENNKKTAKKSQLGARYRNKYAQKQILKSSKTALLIQQQFKENFQLFTKEHHENLMIKASPIRKQKNNKLEQIFSINSGLIKEVIEPSSYCLEVELKEVIEQLGKQLIGKDSIIKNQEELMSHYKTQLAHYEQRELSLLQISQEQTSQHQFNCQPSKQINDNSQYLYQRLVALQQQLYNLRKCKTQLQNKILEIAKNKTSQFQIIRKKAAKQIEKWREMYFSLRMECKSRIENKQNDL